MARLTTDNYKKHKSDNPLQRFFIQNFYKTLLEEARSVHPKHILDVGCGEGFTLEKLHANDIGEELVGIDFLETAIAIGKKEHPYLDLRQGNIYDIPFDSNSFDLVICSEVLEHLEDPVRALDELHRVANTYVLLSVPNEPFFLLSNFLRGKNLKRFGNDIEHINHWSISGFEKFVRTKFTITKRRQPFPWTLVLAKKS